MISYLITKQRLRRKQSLDKLASKINMPTQQLADIESGKIIPPIPQELLLRIADKLKFNKAIDFSLLITANKVRQFRAYNVGIGKTGTNSITNIFG